MELMKKDDNIAIILDDEETEFIKRITSLAGLRGRDLKKIIDSQNLKDVLTVTTPMGSFDEKTIAKLLKMKHQKMHNKEEKEDEGSGD